MHARAGCLKAVVRCAAAFLFAGKGVNFQPGLSQPGSDNLRSLDYTGSKFVGKKGLEQTMTVAQHADEPTTPGAFQRAGCNSQGEGRIECLPLDVASDKSVKAAADFVQKKFGADPPPLYGIVNNAGVGRNYSTCCSCSWLSTLGPKLFARWPPV